MSIVKRVPVTGSDLRLAPTWPSQIPGDHPLKLSVNLDYSMTKVAVSKEKKRQSARKMSPSRRKASTDEYKRLYLTYSIGGQIEGKTDVLNNGNGSWTANHEANVGTEFLSNIYQKPTEFVVWEIRRLDENERREEKEEMILGAGKAKRKSGLADFTVGKGPINFNTPRRKKGPVAGASTHGTSGTGSTDDKVLMTVAQTGGLSLKQKLKLTKHAKDDIAAIYNIEPEVDISLRPEEQALQLTEEPDTVDALPTKDFSHLGEEILQGVSKAMHYKSLSSPDLTGLLNHVTEDFRKLDKRAISDFPMDRYRPGSSLHRFLHEDFGIRTTDMSQMHPLGGHHHSDGASVSHTGGKHSRSSSNHQAPHPHHFNHPEKHVPADSIRSGMVRSRSSSSLSSLHALHPKTPPSPHHSDHPLTILAPRGKVNVTGSQAKNNKGGKSKSDERGINAKSDSNLQKSTPTKKKKGEVGSAVNSQAITSNPPAKVKKGKTTTKTEQPKRIRWDADHAGIYQINWKELPLEEAERRANDQPIYLHQEKLPVEKRKGDFVHTPIARLLVDVTGLFFDDLEIKAKVANETEGISKCDITMKLDTPLLSQDQLNKLKPMLFMLGSATDMPSQPISYQRLDELCHPVSAKFRFFSDFFLHTAQTTVPHGQNIDFNSRHLVLAGLIDPTKLRDTLVKETLQVEIHDRDYKLPGDLSKVQAELKSDGLLHCSLNPLNPHGVASFSLLELCNGVTTLELSVPVLPGPSTASQQTHAHKGPHFQKNILPPGRWLEHGTMLSLRIEARTPIISDAVGTVSSNPLAKGIYGHVVIATSPENDSVAKVVHEVLLRCNGEALGLELPKGPDGDLDLARLELDLATYLLSQEQKNNPSLDFMTGYDIFDSKGRVYFFEGLLDGGISKLLQALSDLPTELQTSFQLHHSPKIGFFHRSWKGITPTLTHIHLHTDISQILSSPTAYSRSKPGCRLSPDAYACLILVQNVLALGDLSIQSKMSHWFPTQKMVVSLLGGFGEVVPFAEAMKRIAGDDDKSDSNVTGEKDILEEEDGKRSSQTKNRQSISASKLSRSSTVSTRQGSHRTKTLEETTLNANHDPEQEREDLMNKLIYLQRRHRLREPNFVELARRAHPSKAAPRERSTQLNVYNYSMQTFSTTSDKLFSLRNKLAEDTSVYHTFNGDFFSQTLSPIDMDEEKKLEEIQSRLKWLTRQGFDTSRSNTQPLSSQLTQARKEELKQPWQPRKRNILFSST